MHHGEVLGQRRRHAMPDRVRLRMAVQQQQRRAAAADAAMQRTPSRAEIEGVETMPAWPRLCVARRRGIKQ